MDHQIIPISPALLSLLSGEKGGLVPFTREIFLLDIVVAGTTFCENIEEDHRGNSVTDASRPQKRA